MIISARINNKASPAANSAAIAAAIAEAQAVGGNVRIPAGEYEHEGFSLAAGVSVFGDGLERTVLVNTHPTNSSVRMVGRGGGEYLSGAEVHGMTLSADSARPGQVGVMVLLARAVNVSQVHVTNHGIGVQHKASWAQLYSQVRVSDCTVGWHVPEPSPYTSSTPVTMIACHAVNCGTGLKVDDGLEGFLWLGGDMSRCSTGILLNGDQTRQLMFSGLNFEQISMDAIVVGRSGGPAGVTFSNCRFFNDAGGGQRSVDYLRGTHLTFTGCRWTGFEVAIQQSDKTGPLLLFGCSVYKVTDFLDLNGTKRAVSPLLVTQGSAQVHGWPVQPGMATLVFGSVAAQSATDLTIPVTGANIGDCVCLGVPAGAVPPPIIYTAWVSTADSVTVRAHNISASTVDVPPGVFKVAVVR
ncbi:hypothetical protein [Mycolicibacterium monacense]|uniref:hypothetical protein n=1 Tax=Mycolicibacterium monacense TaxID=85693 RepID=UPI001041E8DF|nr:hypothetical protein [Mycolicibacterium monacense]